MTHHCPTCDRTLSTKQGMRQHHTKVHGDPLPNRTCKGCEQEFYDPKAQRSFCDDCNPNAGEHNGNWKDAMETAECRLCGSSFEYYPSDKDGVFCPTCVEEAEGFLGTPSYELREIERVAQACEQCGVVSMLLRTDVERGRGRFCNRTCHAAWMSENWRGENHHAWRGNDNSGWYTGRWWRIQQEALERDGHTCRLCGATREEMGSEPDVHHIDPIRTFENPQNAHTLDNVVCLCKSCHNHAEAVGLGRSDRSGK
jgi:hypothetical protein